jgi:fumarate hydratase class I
LRLPLAEPEVRELAVGQSVDVSGLLLTARESGHRYLLDHEPRLMREHLQGGAVYHCGPLVRKMKRKEEWRIVAAGPSASIHLDEFTPALIARYGVRLLIGTGGMGPRTLDACRRHGAVYLAAVGGAGAELAKCVVRVHGVSKIDFGTPEALWKLEVRHFPALVAMDSRGESLYEQVARTADDRFRDLVT